MGIVYNGRTKREMVVEQHQLDDGPLYAGDEYTEGSLVKIIESLHEILAEIPPEHRAKAIAWFEPDMELGMAFNVAYMREETEEERLAAERADERRRQDQSEREMREFMRLKEKFEPMFADLEASRA